MNKKIVYIKPIKLDEQIEDKINKNIPIKTKESLSHFKNEGTPKFNLNDNYFQTISQRECFHSKNKKLETIQLKNITKLKQFKNKNIINDKCLVKKRKNNNYNINLKINNLDNETMKILVNQRKCLHKLYAKDKRIINHSYIDSTLSKNKDKSYKQDKKIDISKINKNIYISSKTSKNKNKKIIKDKKGKNIIKLGLYDPSSRSLRYMHYSDNYNNSIKKALTLNNSIVNKINNSKESDFNNDIIYGNYINTISFNEINNNFNESLVKHRKENQQNLIRLKKSLFNNKRINYYIKKSEESKSNTIKNEKDIYKININEQIKNIINHERKKLEKSIDAYNQKLEMNFNKKNILFKNYDMTKYKTEMGESKENEYLFDNMNIIADFHFQRENKL